MKTLIKVGMRSLGYDITRLTQQPLTTPLHRVPAPDPIPVAIATLMSTLPPGQKLTIVQVGANDGRINDPIHTIAKSFPKRTRLLLVEPQTDLIPILTETYTFHPDVRIENCAIGDGGTLTLFAVAQKYWDQTQPNYARGWPAYRAPTGVTSGDRSHVEHWLKIHFKGAKIPQDAITEITVPARSLPNLISDWRSGVPEIDVLQIDAEGLDDMIVYNADLERSAPKVVNFETGHVSESRAEALNMHLSAHGYKMFRHKRDALCIRAWPGKSGVKG